MENTQPTFKEIRKFLKPWLEVSSDWSEAAVKIFRENKTKIVVKVCYSIVYDKNHKQRNILNEVEAYLTKAGFEHNGHGTFKRKENLEVS